MGTTIRLLANHFRPSHQPVNIGSFNNLYRSVKNLDPVYFGTKQCKDMLLNTRISAEDQCRNLKIVIDDMKPIQYFICNVCRKPTSTNSYLSNYGPVKCRNCGKLMEREREMNYNVTKCESSKGIFAIESVSFVISDDLHVIPNNPDLTLGILESSGIKDFAVLEENILKLGASEILDLLECSFLSNTPLSDIFFGRKWITSPVPTIRMRISTSYTDSKKMKINVFLQKSKNKILLAHSSKDFIDFLFSLLTIPLGRVFSLLTKDHESTFSIENIHKSVSELKVYEYLKSQELKDELLTPKLFMNYLCPDHIFPLEEVKVAYILYYGNYLTVMQRDIQDPKGEGGFVRGPTKFMVTDDLVITPLSSMSCFTYLHKLGVTPSDIEEQVIDVGMEEALHFC